MLSASLNKIFPLFKNVLRRTVNKYIFDNCVFINVCFVFADPCIASCDGLESGNYQSCLGCDVFATCVHGNMYDNRSCQETPWGLSWDDNTKRCQNFSDTCPYIIDDGDATQL